MVNSLQIILAKIATLDCSVIWNLILEEFLVGSVAFHASLGAYDTMPLNTVVIFPEVGLNIGNG